MANTTTQQQSKGSSGPGRKANATPDTRPHNERYAEAANRRLGAIRNQLDSLERLGRGRTAYPTPDQAQATLKVLGQWVQDLTLIPAKATKETPAFVSASPESGSGGSGSGSGSS